MAEKLCLILATAAALLTYLESRGAPVHQLDTLPSFDDRQKVMAEKLSRVLARAALLTLKPVGHQFTSWMHCLGVMTDNMAEKTYPDPGNSLP
jgi:hypothetical protein